MTLTSKPTLPPAHVQHLGVRRPLGYWVSFCSSISSPSIQRNVWPLLLFSHSCLAVSSVAEGGSLTKSSCDEQPPRKRPTAIEQIRIERNRMAYSECLSPYSLSRVPQAGRSLQGFGNTTIAHRLSVGMSFMVIHLLVPAQRSTNSFTISGPMPSATTVPSAPNA